uniref:WD40/YVTN/BNR-like repeat-containing protein n=1 Tax=Flavobacterium sp. TaxID=239 RepID=UPI0040496889
MKKIIFLFLIISSLSFAQTNLFEEVKFQSIGPTIMSGRVVDVAVNPENPTEFYAAYASGGLWYTNNNGTSFSPVMDNAPTQNCGSLTVDWKTETIWVGTGEVNASRSSYAGIGILKSSDKGKTWENLGLPESHHISRICVNPNNINEITVGVVGKLYIKNQERGIYKTLDGGKTWKKTLFINEETGIIDVVVSPTNFNIQYAAAWQKDRKAWDFKGNGKNSGIYKSTDAGNSWSLVTTETSGFPNNEGVGRIGLAIFNDNILYAVLDNQNKRPASAKSNGSLPIMMSSPGEDFAIISNKELNSALKSAGLREKYRAENIKNFVEASKLEPKDAFKVLQDANNALFDTEVIGCEVYKSIDGGTSWKKMNEKFIDDFYYTYGYYFANISVDAKDENRIYIGAVPLLFSDNGGKSFEVISKENVHADHHVTWINPNNQNHIINGNDGGINISYDNGASWLKCNNQAVGQFYAVQVDNEENYNIYGGLQDNGVWFGPNNYQHDRSWQQEGKYPYQSIMGGDGMQIQVDNRNVNIVYTGFQFGNYYRIDKSTEKSESITPKSEKGEKPFRFNWQTPVLLSSHNQDIVYFGSQYLHRSMNQGKSWEKISQDVTKGFKEGNVAYGTITTISESPFQFGLLYVGSDDGLMHVTKDGGNSWTKIEIPENASKTDDLWVSRIVASQHKKERVYATLNGYRNDDFTSYVYVSDNYGTTWTNISKGLTNAVNVLVEDSEKENILYVGTDNNLFISLDKGLTWQDFSAEMPNVAVHDLKIQAKAKDLIVGTHGRSIYKVNLGKIQTLTDTILAKSLHLFPLDKIKKSKNWGNSWSSWSDAYEPKTEIWVFANQNQETTLNIVNKDKINVYSKKLQLQRGLNKVVYDLSIDSKTLEKLFKKDKKLEITPSKNGKLYLPKDIYTISIEKEAVTLEIYESK